MKNFDVEVRAVAQAGSPLFLQRDIGVQAQGGPYVIFVSLATLGHVIFRAFRTSAASIHSTGAATKDPSGASVPRDSAPPHSYT
jgi:hypothetical protein